MISTDEPVRSSAPTYLGHDVADLSRSNIDEALEKLAEQFNKEAGVEQADINPVIPSEPLVYPPNTGGAASFFGNASDGVATGRIPGDTDTNGKPLWMKGSCWRPLRCLYPDIYPIDCEDCGAFAPDWAATTAYTTGQRTIADIPGGTLPHVWKSKSDRTSGATFDGTEAAEWQDMGPDIFGELNHPATEKANAFQVVFRDKIDITTEPVTADALRAHMGIAFGSKLWDQVTDRIDAGTLEVPAQLVDNCNSADIVVATLEHESGFAGEGTLVVPTLFLPYLLEKRAILESNGGRLRTPAGNRVISEGVSISTVAGGASGTANIALLGPVDYARTAIAEDSETGRDRANKTAMVINMFGIVRTDFCAASRGCAVVPAGVAIQEVP